MKTAVIILNWNGQEMLKRFLPSLIEHTSLPDTELWVVDNASTDNSYDQVSQFPQIHWLPFDKNYGFAEGYDRAIEQIEADYVVLLNSDVELTDQWLQPLVQALDEQTDLGALQPKIRAYRNKPFFEHAGAAGGFIDHWGYPYCRGRIMGHVEEDLGQYDMPIDSFWATGACLVTRRKLFLELGGLDASFFAHMEEIDFCWRLRSRGYRICCIPQSTVFHWGGGALSKENPFKTYLNFRNNLLMLYKNLSADRLHKVMIARFFFDWAAALQMLVVGHTGDFKAVCRARRDYHKSKSEYRQKREENIRLMINPHPAEMHKRSIVIDYYLKGKRK